MSKIREIKAREIIDSRGNPTIEVDVHLSDGAFGRFAVPSGASTGEHEALELRDCDPKRYSGKGVLKAAANVEKAIALKIIGIEFTDIKQLDNMLLELDGTENKSKLGANSMLGVSLATAKAMASEKNLEFFEYLNPAANLMPVPLMNVINGGEHADNGLSIQEFMIVPAGAPTFKEALRYGAEIFHALKEILAKKSLSTGVGDEGGFAPNINNTNEACEYLMEAICLAGFGPGEDVFLAIDAASSEFYDASQNVYTLNEVGRLNSDEFIEFWVKLCDAYPIVSIEDPFDENDWDAWANITKKLGSKIQIVGDDLFATNPKLLSRGVKESSANSLLVKVNQIGTLSETLSAINMAKESGFSCIISHRSGETEDTVIADLAVGTSVGQIKTGSLSRSDRLAKYNRLLRIEEIVGTNAKYVSPF